MVRTLNRHIDEIIMILAELIIAILLMLQLPSVVKIITVCVGVLSMIVGGCCIKRYYHTIPTYTRYAPELQRGIILVLVGVVISTMQLWFTVTTSAPAIALGITLLTVAFFKTAVVCDAKSSTFSYLFLPTLSAFFTFALSFFSMFAPVKTLSARWIWISTLMMLVLLIDAYEIYASETKNREPWSMRIRCWM